MLAKTCTLTKFLHYIYFYNVGVPWGTFLFEGEQREMVCLGCSVTWDNSHEARKSCPKPRSRIIPLTTAVRPPAGFVLVLFQ